MLAKRLFNLREGWTRAEDWLPDRFLSESLELESGRKATLTADRLDAMISSYYRGRGLEPSGVPRAVNRGANSSSRTRDAWTSRFKRGT